MILLAMAGAARSGKDTLAKTIQAFVPNTVTLAFAHAVKEEAEPLCQAQHGISAFTLDPEEKKIIRPILIQIGHGRRQEDPLIWIKRLSAKIDEVLPNKHVIITDCRYKNEADMVHSKGGLVVMVKRDSQEDIPTERESLPLVPWDIMMDFRMTDTITLVKQIFPGWQP